MLVDEHCIPPVFSLETSELCPHVYKHLFSTVTLVLKSCYKVFGEKLLEGTSQNFASLFAAKIFSKYNFSSRTCMGFYNINELSKNHTCILK